MRHTFTITVEAKRGLAPDDSARIDHLIAGYVTELVQLEPALVGARVLSSHLQHDVSESPAEPQADGAPADFSRNGRPLAAEASPAPAPIATARLTIELDGRARFFEVLEFSAPSA